MKIAITGKGGVGKTTLSALLINRLAEQGKKVIAVDADPDANLASALGFRSSDGIVPIADMASLIEERTGAKPGQSGSFFKINPKVDDLPEKLWEEMGNIRLMVLGTVNKGGGGCICPESALLKNLVTHLVLFMDEVVVLDMEAGIEHLGRGTARAVDVLIVVVEPGKRSIETAFAIRKLAKDLGLENIVVVGNKIRKQSDEDFLKENVQGLDIAGFLPFSDSLIDFDIEGAPALSVFSENVDGIIRSIST